MDRDENLWAAAEQALSCGGHDLSHVRRVYAFAMKLAESFPDIDEEILSASVILHDIARVEEDNDPDGRIDHAVLGAQRAEELLLSRGWEPARAAWAAACIRTHRYRGGGDGPATEEAKLLFDADKLDCLGTVGVARMFMLSGQYGEQLYIVPPKELEMRGHAPKISDFSQYSPNLEYLLKMRFIPERLFTEPARALAKPLMARMDRFFDELREELGL